MNINQLFISKEIGPFVIVFAYDLYHWSVGFECWPPKTKNVSSLFAITFLPLLFGIAIQKGAKI